MGRDALGAFEQWVMMVLVRLGADAYGRSIHEELQSQLSREIALGQVYVALERLEEKGFVTSRLGGSTRTRGGRAKRYFKVTASGSAALRESLDILERLRPAPGWSPA